MPEIIYVVVEMQVIYGELHETILRAYKSQNDAVEFIEKLQKDPDKSYFCDLVELY